MMSWLMAAVVAAGWVDSPRVFEGPTQSITAVAFSADGKQVASGGTDKEIRIWTAADGKLVRTLKGSSQAVQMLAFSPRGEYLASGDAGLELKLWDLAKGEALKTWLHEEPISTVAFVLSPKKAGEPLLFVGGMADKGAVYSIPEAKRIEDLGARSVQPGARTADTVLGSTEGIEKWRPGTRDKASLIRTGTHVPWVAWASGSKEVLSRSPVENDIIAWNWKSKKEAGRLVGHQKGVTSLAVSPDGVRAISASLDGTVRLWDVKARKELAVIRAQGAIFAAVSPDFSTLAVGEGRYLKVWELPK